VDSGTWQRLAEFGGAFMTASSGSAASEQGSGGRV
jgi:hypothetical protein